MCCTLHSKPFAVSAYYDKLVYTITRIENTVYTYKYVVKDHTTPGGKYVNVMRKQLSVHIAVSDTPCAGTCISCVVLLCTFSFTLCVYGDLHEFVVREGIITRSIQRTDNTQYHIICMGTHTYRYLHGVHFRGIQLLLPDTFHNVQC